MPSLVNTSAGFHSTVCALMNNCAAISGLLRHSPARRAIYASWAVSASPDVTERLRTFSPVALGERVRSHAGQHLMGGTQLRAGIDAPVAAPKPCQNSVLVR